jgi:prephenate dehydratase
MIVGFQGVRGAYSELAIYKHFGEGTKTKGYDASEEVILALMNREVDCAMLPIENSIAGTVTVNCDLLQRYDVAIIAEIFLPIHHCLLSHKGSTLDEVKEAFSHPVALDQCKEFIKKHHLKAMPEFDTAGSAKIVSERKKKGEGAIASEFCASIYGMEVFAKNIETVENNSTRFLCIVKQDTQTAPFIKEKTSIVFKTKHYPGALINCLQRLSKHNINLTKLESRPCPENPWEYVFFADFEGGTDDEHIKKALNEMEASSLFLKVLGSYPKGKQEHLTLDSRKVH